MNELKPCPFCGTKAARFIQRTSFISVANRDEVTGFGCKNGKCRVQPRINLKTGLEEQEAKDAWNRRPKDE